VAATSAVTGAWGASTSAAGFGQVGWSSIALKAPKQCIWFSYICQ